jgi:hypothetical protein
MLVLAFVAVPFASRAVSSVSTHPPVAAASQPGGLPMYDYQPGGLPMYDYQHPYE